MLWPLPALAVWAAAWAAYGLLGALGAAAWLTLTLASLLALAIAPIGATKWRQVFIAGGFPLSLAASGLATGVPAWAWLVPLALLLLLYPLRSWRDAPWFPTPRGALAGLAIKAALPPAARVVDAGCGLGDGLRELHREYPTAQLEGLEWSWPLATIASLRCHWAKVRRRDLWTADWSRFDMVYLFQRPESMPRAIAKAAAELRPGAWLASLEFEALSLPAQAVHHCADGRRVWLYRAPLAPLDG